MINFDATATYSVEHVQTTVRADGSATVRIRNRDANGNAIGELDMTIPATHTNNVQHERTGDTGLAIGLDLGDAIDAVNAQAVVLLQAVVDNDKHSL